MGDKLDGSMTDRSRIDIRDVEAELKTIVERDAASSWEVGKRLDFGESAWVPPAVSSSGDQVLYISFQSELPRFVVKRLLLCQDKGISATIALPIASLFSPELLEVLIRIDADVLVIDDYHAERRYRRRHCLAALADIAVPLSPEVRRSTGLTVWSRLSDGTNQEKGKRLEALLAFVFSQVTDFKVIERNYRTETEEIDVVLQVDNFSSRAWHKPGSPFILVEAKNWAVRAGQPVMSVLISKLQTKRGSTKLAFLVSLGGFTEDARVHELRYSTSAAEICVVMVDGPGLKALLEAPDLDDAVETLIRRALLR